MKLRVNGSIEQATPVLERFAQVGFEIEAIETARDKAVSDSNAVADVMLAPLLKEQAELREQIEPWWHRTGVALLPAKRKTMELLGCMIGSKSGRSSLMTPSEAIKALKTYRWGKDLIRVTEEVDKTAVRAALKGKHGERLSTMGFYVSTPGEEFVLERVAQAGTTGKGA